MIHPRENRFERRVLSVLCSFVICGILVAGLWPFHAPSNGVTWFSNANGLRFASHGIVLSSSMFNLSSSQDQASCSLEIWLQPQHSLSYDTVLAFYAPTNAIQFALLQSHEYLGVQTRTESGHVHAKAAGVVYVGNVFADGKLLLITIASGQPHAAVYLDGALATTSAPFQLSPGDCNGQLVLGTSPIENSNWSGQLRGLAIYGQELTATQVSRHFETWSTKGRPDLSQNERVTALYLFDDHQGHIVHDHGGSGIDLYIPERYMILHEKLLEPPWREFQPTWSYWKGVGINIGGFIPLGFFFCAYLTAERQLNRPGLITIILGAAVSVTIEILQSYLPTRDSGITDIITNTLGTSLGVVLYRWNAALLDEILRHISLLARRS